jgi:HSP20 family molecular chaperone IbpA
VKENYLHLERAFGSFSRSFSLAKREEEAKLKQTV